MMEIETNLKQLLSRKPSSLLPLTSSASTLASIGSSLSDYTLLKEAGRGGSGVVYKVQSQRNNSIYALKKIHLRHVQKRKDSSFLRQVQFLKALRHPNILESYGHFIEGDSLYIVTEFADYGDLRRLIKNQKEKSKRIGEQEVWNIIWQIALGLLHLHSHRIIHRDIKAPNILITRERKVKIADLGEFIFLDKSKPSRIAGTPLYLSPEVIKGEEYDQRVDIWGLGCILYELLSFTPPFVGNSYEDLFERITNKMPKEVSCLYSDSLINLLSAMLEKSLTRRPFIDTVIRLFPKDSHALTKEIDLENFKKYKASRAKTMLSTQQRKLAFEFQVLKNQLLESNPDNFIPEKRFNLPSIKRKHSEKKGSKTISLASLQNKVNASRGSVNARSELGTRNYQLKSPKDTMKSEREEEENARPRLPQSVVAFSPDIIAQSKRVEWAKQKKYRILEALLVKERSLIDRIKLRGKICHDKKQSDSS